MQEYKQVIDFWFSPTTQAKWWVKDDDFDQHLRDSYKELHQSANQCELFHWRSSPYGRLAEIIVLDQFSRNMFRDTPQSFASDSLALMLAQEAITLGVDKQLSAIEKSFLYMPYMHSESKIIQQQSIDLYQRKGLEQNLDFAQQHKDIIDRFGRYPHRNQILGRKSTPQEIEFLTQPGSSF